MYLERIKNETMNVPMIKKLMINLFDRNTELQMMNYISLSAKKNTLEVCIIYRYYL